MARLATTKLSSKGQVVIPEEIRNELGLLPGAQFVVVGDRDVIILKTVTGPAMKDYDSIIAKTRRQARRAGMKRADIEKAALAARRSR